MTATKRSSRISWTCAADVLYSESGRPLAVRLLSGEYVLCATIASIADLSVLGEWCKRQLIREFPELSNVDVSF